MSALRLASASMMPTAEHTQSLVLPQQRSTESVELFTGRTIARTD